MLWFRLERFRFARVFSGVLFRDRKQHALRSLQFDGYLPGLSDIRFHWLAGDWSVGHFSRRFSTRFFESTFSLYRVHRVSTSKPVSYTHLTLPTIYSV